MKRHRGWWCGWNQHCIDRGKPDLRECHERPPYLCDYRRLTRDEAGDWQRNSTVANERNKT